MRAIDKLAQIFRRSVQMERRKKIDPVVAPSEISGKIGDRHHLHDSDSNPRQFGQLFGRGLPRSFFRKRSNMHFINDVTFHFHAAPF